MNEPSYTVAILDDEAQMRKALRRLLESNGYRVEDYEQGNDLLQALSSRSIDCLILDLHLPKLNGFDILAVIQSRNITTRVIALTAHDEPGVKERVLRLGAMIYLTKPVDEAVLLSAINTARNG
jgi:FixJ family two-component response regulator